MSSENLAANRTALTVFGAVALGALVALGTGLWLWTHPAPRTPASVVVPITAAVRPHPPAAPRPAAATPGKVLALDNGGPMVPSLPSYSAFSAQHGLLPAPAADLIERGSYGFLPIVGHDGRNPWQVYARPFDLTDPSPRVAIIVTGLAISGKATKDAIEQTPLDVTLAFAPFGRHVTDWVSLARATGHEVLLELPMEPIDYPRQDPGLNTLLTAYDSPQNLDRLGWVMSQAAGYTGLIGRMGGKFQASRGDMTPIVDEIAKRGLLFVDNREAVQSVVPQVAGADKLPLAVADRVIDADPSRIAVDQALIDLTNSAIRNGSAVGLASASPVTIQEITAWAATLANKGVMLAPVSAIVTVPRPPAPEPPAGQTP